MNFNENHPILTKIILILLFIFVVVACGSFGYWYIEDYSILDAIYMTVITLTTTGFGEVVPLTSNGKIFTMVLLLIGVAIVTYSLTTIMNYIVSIDFSNIRREKMEKKISQLKGHTIVCGYGRMGEIICKKLHEEGVTFVVVEKRENLIALLKKNGFLHIEGDASSDENLEKAGIKEAKTLVSVIDSDTDGLYIALAGRSFNPDLFIIVRANERKARRRMIRAGADKVILPFVMSGMKVAESVINPEVEETFSISQLQTSTKIQIVDLLIEDQSTTKGRDIQSVGKEISEIIIVGVKKSDESLIFNPKGEYLFEAGDTLIAMGERASCLAAVERFNLSYNPKQTLTEPS